MRAALVESIKWITQIFKGDGSGANVRRLCRRYSTGLQTPASIDESTLTQANKIKGDKILDKVDGLICLSTENMPKCMSDLSVVNSVGSTRLWLKTIQNATAENQTIAIRFLRSIRERSFMVVLVYQAAFIDPGDRKRAISALM